MQEIRQERAESYAEKIKEKGIKGKLSNLPLSELQDIPISLLDNPLSIATSLIELLGTEGIWTHDRWFQIRSTIARQARKYLVCYLLKTQSTKGQALKLKNRTDEILKMTSIRQKVIGVNSGVEAEFKVISTLVETLQTNKGWWAMVRSTGLFDICSKRKLPLLSERVTAIFDSIGSLLSPGSLVERSLIIERLFSMKAQAALSLFTEILEGEQPWESQYLSLAYLEWGIHRSKFTDEQLETLYPLFESLIAMNHTQLNEKLMTIMLKLRDKEVFSDLLSTVKGNLNSSQLAFFERLQPQMLAPETKLACIKNFEISDAEITGRDSKLKEVERALERDSTISLVGVPGMGKSTLAKKVAERLAKHFEIVWICPADDGGMFEASLKELGSLLGVESSSRDEYRVLLNALSSYHRVFILFDNASYKHFEVCQMFEKKSRICILYTSSDRSFPNPITVGSLTEDVAMAIMQKIPRQRNEELRELVRKLSCAPLALKLVKGYMEAEQLSVRDMLCKLDTDIGYLNDQGEDDCSQLTRIVEASVSAAIRQRPDLKVMLFLSSTLASDDVPLDLYETLVQSLMLQTDVKKLLCTAKAYCLVDEGDSSNKRISIHRLVQSTIQQRTAKLPSHFPELLAKILELMKTDQLKEVLRCCRSVVDFILNSQEPGPGLEFCIEFLHSEIEFGGVNKKAKESLLKLYSFLKGTVDSMNVRALVAAGYMLNQCGFLKKATTICDAARRKGTRDLTIQEKNFVYDRLAAIYQDNGQSDLAEEMNAESFTSQEIIPSTDFPELSAAYFCTALLYKKIDFDRAEEFNLKCLSIREMILPHDHADIGLSYYNIGVFYQAKGDYDKAEHLYITSLSSQEGVLSPHTAMATSNYSKHLLSQAESDYSRALQFHMRSLAIRESMLCPNQAALAATYKCLAELYQAKDDSSSAEQFFMKYLAVNEIVLGSDNPDLVSSYCSLAIFYQAKGEFKKACQLLVKCLALKKASQSSEVELSAINTDSTYTEQPEVGSEEFFMKCSEILEKYFGLDHPDLACCFRHLGFIHQSKGDFQMARDFFTKSLRIRENVLKSQPGLANSYFGIVAIYKAHETYDRVEKLRTKSSLTCEGSDEQIAKDSSASFSNIGGLHHANCNYDSAEELLIANIATQEKELGPNDPDLAVSYNYAALLYLAKGDFNKAEEFLVKYLAKQEQILATAPDLHFTYISLALLANIKGNPGRAKEYRVKAGLGLSTSQ